MRAIWKWTVPVDDKLHTFEMPHGARIVHVAQQVRFDEVQFWAEVDTSMQRIPRTFVVRGTGHNLDAGLPDDHVALHVGTVLPNSAYVWHLCEVWP